jgi:hypothetical protein
MSSDTVPDMSVLRLVPKRRQSLVTAAKHGYFALLVGLLVIIAGLLALTLAVTLLGW